jgi:5'(3')-deoxyribonucleotidase
MNTNRPIVLVDMDGVLADFDAGIESQLTADILAAAPFSSRTSFYIRDTYPEHQAVIETIHNAEGFFRNLPLIDGALEGWQKLIDLGYEPRICSSPLLSHMNCEEEKLAWLEEHFVPHFGQSVVENAIITRDKFSCDGIALIDDKPDIKRMDEACWQHIVFDHSYNQAAKSTLRLYSWNDPNLPNLLEAAKKASPAA